MVAAKPPCLRAIGARHLARPRGGPFDRWVGVERPAGPDAAMFAGNLGPPLGASDGRDLDPVLAPVDDFVETVQVHGCFRIQTENWGASKCSVRAAAIKRRDHR